MPHRLYAQAVGTELGALVAIVLTSTVFAQGIASILRAPIVSLAVVGLLFFGTLGLLFVPNINETLAWSLQPFTFALVLAAPYTELLGPERDAAIARGAIGSFVLWYVAPQLIGFMMQSRKHV